MKFYKANNEVMAIEQGQEFLVKADWVEMTVEEIELFKNPPKSEEQLIDEWKANRQTLVDNIEVTYQGVVYQGDEVSQTRMSRAITALPDDEITITWVAKDNSEHNLNRLDIKAILFQAGLQQSNIWNLDRP